MKHIKLSGATKVKLCNKGEISRIFKLPATGSHFTYQSIRIAFVAIDSIP
jgi:hypothetical protein